MDNVNKKEFSASGSSLLNILTTPSKKCFTKRLIICPDTEMFIMVMQHLPKYILHSEHVDKKIISDFNNLLTNMVLSHGNNGVYKELSEEFSVSMRYLINISYLTVSGISSLNTDAVMDNGIKVLTGYLYIYIYSYGITTYTT